MLYTVLNPNYILIKPYPFILTHPKHHPTLGHPDWESVALCKYQHYPTLDTYLSLSFHSDTLPEYQPYPTNRRNNTPPYIEYLPPSPTPSTSPQPTYLYPPHTTFYYIPLLHIEVRLPVLLCAVKTVEGDFRFCWTITPNVGQTHKENPNLVRILYMVCTLNDIYKQYNKLHEY